MSKDDGALNFPAGKDINNVISCYEQVATAAIDAGFCITEVRGDTGYIVNQFLQLKSWESFR